MTSIPLLFHKRSHLPKVLEDLLSCGWRIVTAPENRRIPRNGMKVILKADEVELSLRIFAYKVTSSSRNRAHERRVEITTTYKSGLKPLKGFADLVLGVDTATGKYVGVDSKRLHFGGPTHNASSFFDLEGLSVKPGELLINPRRAAEQIFPGGTELHSFFDRSRLSEYFFNHREIHSASYSYGGAFNGSIPAKKVSLPLTIPSKTLTGSTFVLVSKERKHGRVMTTSLIEAAESEDYAGLETRKITPEQLKQLLAICDEVGALGEQAVLAVERNRLKKLGFAAKAKDVERVSLRSVGEGYDIISFEDDGTTRRYLEVKSTVGRGLVVDISRGEWRAAKRLRERYYLVRVMDTKTSPELHFVRDPFQLDKDGLLDKAETGWKLDLSRVIKQRRNAKKTASSPGKP